ncbi:MAG: putative HtrA2 peptidase [Candidatus Saccharibacteria bacterium]|nr:putative HtrA2 peptidase [Candidatus Saccharibacteria bacterium]MDB5181190.1 putative HtrA2 peptidase [Candidatus Saccharibacteria bacterium]
MKRKSVIITLVAITAVLLLTAFGFAGGMYIQKLRTGTTYNALNSTSDGNTSVTNEESTIAAIAEKVGPSVVSIVTKSQAQSYYGTASQQGAGTGIIVSSDGYIMTNNHVIEDANDVVVIDSTGVQFDDVTVIGRDPLNDVAFLKVKSNATFKPVTLGTSSTLRIGQQVVAIGNALGQYSNTVTSGIISGVGRPVTAEAGNGQTETLTDLIQTDASINPGNSGGPLLNMAGQVIGINTAIAADANGIGFSIPINSTKGVLAGVLEKGKISRAYMGVNYLSVTPDVAKQYKLTVKDGAYVYATDGSAVASGSPAEKAGLKNNDVIVKINDDTIGKQGSLSSIIGQYKPGDTVTVTYLRGGNSNTTQLTFSAYSS